MSARTASMSDTSKIQMYSAYSRPWVTPKENVSGPLRP